MIFKKQDYQKIKNCRLILCVWWGTCSAWQEVVRRFEGQEDTTKHLEALQKDNEKQITRLKEEKEKLQMEFEEMKYTGDAKLSRYFIVTKCFLELFHDKFFVCKVYCLVLLVERECWRSFKVIYRRRMTGDPLRRITWTATAISWCQWRQGWSIWQTNSITSRLWVTNNTNQQNTYIYKLITSRMSHHKLHN